MMTRVIDTHGRSWVIRAEHFSRIEFGMRLNDAAGGTVSTFQVIQAARAITLSRGQESTIEV